MHVNSPEMECNWTDSELCKISWSNPLKIVKYKGMKKKRKTHIQFETSANLLFRTPESLQVFRIDLVCSMFFVL